MAGLWKSVFTGILANITGNPNLRGREGEHLVGYVLSKLPESEYSFYEDLLLPSSRGGSTQIDHVVFSRFGIFVIETKNYGGWIFAGENDRVWTQIRFRQKHKFQNPLRQNYKHIKALQELTGLPRGVFLGIVVFTGDAVFKTEKPKGILDHPGNLRRIIPAHTKEVLTQSQVNAAILAVLNKTEQFNPAAKRQHVRNLRKKHGE